MINSPIVSIIIPVYNVEKYLCQCLDSVKNQTMTNIEIICIDDGSTDNSGSILDKYATQDSRFVVIHQANAGQSVARNKGIEFSHGKYIAFLDSDDWLEPTMAEKTVEVFSDFKGEIVAFNFQLEYSQQNDKIRLPRHVDSTICMDNSSRLECIRHFEYVIWNKVYRKDFILKNNILFPVGYRYEDQVFSAICACLSSQIYILGESLYHYRQGSGYSTNKPSVKIKIAHIQTLSKLMEELNRRNISQEFISYFSAERYTILRNIYLHQIDVTSRPELRQEILCQLSNSDWKELESTNLNLPAKKRAFFFWLNGQKLKAILIYLSFLFKK